MTLPADYEARVYAGVLGKIIGVYAGRPIENWTHEQIAARFGEVNGYLHAALGVPLVLPDDDITGTFAFLRALPEHGYPRALTPQQVGETWLNLIIEERTILWWGGFGNSTEHTAYLRLKAGEQAPMSGSATRNGAVIAEQIGAQIFIEGWGLVSPGRPEQAARLARAAAQVSHDGAAVHAAVALAVMVALAFGEHRLEALLDAALTFIPADSVIASVHRDLRRWHAQDGDWRRTLARIHATYGYDRYGGNVHVVPNHAVVLLGLLYGDGDFSRAMRVTNGAGWDTDCNAANVGCLLGVKDGLAAFGTDYDWRGPVADRLYRPTADAGRGIGDALGVALEVVDIGRRLAGVAVQARPRFDFSQPGAVQGFQVHEGEAHVSNPAGRGLIIQRPAGGSARAATPTFIPPDLLAHSGYGLEASPIIHAGQRLEATVSGPPGSVVHLDLCHYGPDDRLVSLPGPALTLDGTGPQRLSWTLPDPDRQPIAELGLRVRGGPGAVTLHALDWAGAPTLTLGRSAGGGTLWRRTWVNAVDLWEPRWPEAFRLVQNRGRGLLLQGGEAWTDYAVEARLAPLFAEAYGVALRASGLRRYDALLVRGERVQLVRMEGGEQVLAETELPGGPAEPEEEVALRLEAQGSRLRAWADGALLFDLDAPSPRTGGAAALVIERGTVRTDEVRIEPVAHEEVR